MLAEAVLAYDAANGDAAIDGRIETDIAGETAANVDKAGGIAIARGTSFPSMVAVNSASVPKARPGPTKYPLNCSAAARWAVTSLPAFSAVAICVCRTAYASGMSLSRWGTADRINSPDSDR